MPLTVVTWNVNGLRARMALVERLLNGRAPDVLCLQETKVPTGLFPFGDFAMLGYPHVVAVGEAGYAGVAIAAREPLSDVVKGLPGDEHGRLAGARLPGGERIFSLYAPNGGSLGSPEYAYKLEWFTVLRRWLDAREDARHPLLLCGDLNVAPADRDVWSGAQTGETTHTSAAIRRAYADLLDFGLCDAHRVLHGEAVEYTYWDYRGGALRKNQGWRIDLALCTEPLRRRLESCAVDREARAWRQSSDHAPLMVRFR
ncbi:MAG TPA: exodeoxyribonuclease III [Candidatus Dormibacteraeota bacterium]|nr:exodeoxyribonuclease III [Candidatus Dormibacteraeota bacterium]